MIFNRHCPDCNNIIDYKYECLFNQAEKRNSVCKSCRTARANKSSRRRVRRNHNWKGYECIPYSWFSKYFIRRSKGKRIGNINIIQIYDLWIKQDKKCILSKLNIGWEDDPNFKQGHTASIDRIDSSKEYTLDNIQLVHKDINLMKNKFSEEYFIKMCKLIAANK